MPTGRSNAIAIKINILVRRHICPHRGRRGGWKVIFSEAKQRIKTAKQMAFVTEDWIGSKGKQYRNMRKREKEWEENGDWKSNKDHWWKKLEIGGWWKSWRLEADENSIQHDGMLSSLEAFVNSKRMSTKFKCLCNVFVHIKIWLLDLTQVKSWCILTEAAIHKAWKQKQLWDL